MPKRVIDISLINLIIEGDKHQFHWITDEWFDAIYYHILKIVNDKNIAQELTNSAFAKAYLNLKLYKPEHKFSSWLYRIATNIAIDYLRNKKVKPDLQHLHEDHHQIVDTQTPETLYQDNQNYATLHDAINKLKPIYRNIINMRYFGEMSYEEISRKLDMPIGTVKAYIHRAKSKLIQIITNKS